MIRKIYIKHLFERVKNEGALSLLKYAKRYVLTFLSFSVNKSFAGPIQGTLCLTYNCNLLCEMCDLPQRHLNYKQDDALVDLSLNEWTAVIDDFARIGTSAMAISGGEPFLHKDLFKIVEHIKKRGMVTQITSNGWFINEEVAQRLIDSKVDAISISIDGSTEEIHDKIRGVKGSFSKAINALEVLRKVRDLNNSPMSISVSTVLGKSNYESIDDVIGVSKDAGADRIGFMPVHTISPLVDEEKLRLDEKEVKGVFSSIKKLREIAKKDDFIESSDRYLKLFYNFFKKEPLPMKCMAGFTTLVVDCYGRIFPCFSYYEMEKSWGNIKTSGGLLRFWKSQEIAPLRTETKKCRDCYWNCQIETNLLYKFK